MGLAGSVPYLYSKSAKRHLAVVRTFHITASFKYVIGLPPPLGITFSKFYFFLITPFNYHFLTLLGLIYIPLIVNTFKIIVLCFGIFDPVFLF